MCGAGCFFQFPHELPKKKKTHTYSSKNVSSFVATFLPNKAILRLVEMTSLETSARVIKFFFLGSYLTSLKTGIFHFMGTTQWLKKVALFEDIP